ncbi:Chitinase 5, partial [Linum perenne]
TDLCYIEEIQKSTYCDPNAKQWPCAPGKQYFGRGPLQLTWNYNYGPCGRANRFDGLKNPEIVARNPVVAWKTALWYWMKNVRPVVGSGFGATIRAINGALECNGKNPAAVNARVKYYEDYCKRFKVAPGPNLRC